MTNEDFRTFLSNLSDRQIVAVFDTINFDIPIGDCVRLINQEMDCRIHCWFGDCKDEK